MRLSYFHFLLFNVLGGVDLGDRFGLLGYLAGKSWRAVEQWIGRGALIVALVVVGIIVLLRFVKTRA